MIKNLQLLGFTLGVLLLLIGTGMLVPALIDWNDDHNNAAIFLHSALISWFFGGALFFANRGARDPVTVRQAFLLTTMAWIATSIVAAIPLWLSDLDIRFIDAFFESVSGVTTTGSTVLAGLDTMSRGILMWRSLMQMIGGIGIIAFVIILLPLLKIGGMQLFHTESSDQSDKIMPRTGALMKSLVLTYFCLCALCGLTYYVLGMSGFDAINHAFTTISTGGYGTHDTSFGGFSPALQYAASLFMLLGGLPFILYVRAMIGGDFAFHRDPQVRALLVVVAAVTVLLSAYAVWNTDIPTHAALRHALFNIISVITTCGYASTDYLQWGPFAVMAFFFITYLGACAGSTSGGIKMMRLVIATRALAAQFNRLIFPNGVFVISYDGQSVPQRTVFGVLGFLFVYVAANTILTIALSFAGLDFATAISGAATAIANVGPGVGPVIGPAGNFSTLPDAAKWLLCAGMIVGRLEIMTVLVLFTPGFWRK